MSRINFDSESVQYIHGKLTHEALSQAAFRHMTDRAFSPNDVKTSGRVIKCEIRYIPYYRFQGRYEAKWTATFEFRHVEKRQEWERRITGHAQGRTLRENAPVIRTHVTWDKIPSSGETVGEFDLREYAGREFTPAKRGKLTDFVAHASRLGETGVIPEGEVSAESCSVRAEEVFANYIKPQLDKIIANAVKQHAQGDRQSNWHFNASYDNLTATILAIAVGHVIFEYQGQKYHYWASAIDPKCVIADNGPVDSVARFRFVMTILTLGLWLLIPNHKKKAEERQAEDDIEEPVAKTLPAHPTTLKPAKAQAKPAPTQKVSAPVAPKQDLTAPVSQKEAKRRTILWSALLGLLPFCTTLVLFPLFFAIGDKQVTNLEVSIYLLILLLSIVYFVIRWVGLRAYRHSPADAKILGTPLDTKLYLPTMIVGPLIIGLILGFVSPHPLSVSATTGSAVTQPSNRVIQKRQPVHKKTQKPQREPRTG